MIIYQCDKCDKQLKARWGNSDEWVLPVAWNDTEVGELCDECSQEYFKIKEEFMIKKVKKGKK